MSNSRGDDTSQNPPLRMVFETVALGVGTCAGVAAVFAESTVPALVMGMAFAAAYLFKR